MKNTDSSPSSQEHGRLKPTDFFANIHILDSHFKLGSQNFVAIDYKTLKSSFFGKFYTRHVRKYAWMRKIVVEIIDAYIYVVKRIRAYFLLLLSPSRRFKLVKLGEYASVSNTPVVEFLGATDEQPLSPILVLPERLKFLGSLIKQFKFPSIYIAEIENAKVYGGSNFIFVKDSVIIHDLYDLERDYTSEEEHGRHILNKSKSVLHCAIHDPTPIKLNSAATFLDSCAPNYAHWLTEVLPRISLFCRQREHESVPIIINDGLHINLLESLSFVVGRHREIYMLPIGRAIDVERLFTVSPSGYVPYNFRDNRFASSAQGIFSGHIPFLLQNCKTLSKWQSDSKYPKKIYIRRNGFGKKPTNELDLEEFLHAQNFVFIEPEKISFNEQVQLFMNARMIVAGSGAALVNMIFCKPNAIIFVLIGNSPRVSYGYWQGLASLSKVSLHYVLGEVSYPEKNSSHPNYQVPLAELQSAILELV